MHHQQASFSECFIIQLPLPAAAQRPTAILFKCAICSGSRRCVSFQKIAKSKAVACEYIHPNDANKGHVAIKLTLHSLRRRASTTRC
jgi:hypothetical protein